MGEVHPPLSAAKMKKGWGSLGVVVATLPSPKWNCIGRDSGVVRWRSWVRSDDWKWRGVDMVTRWMRWGESPMESSWATRQSLSGYEEVTWVQARPFAPWRDAWQAGGRGPPTLMWIVNEEMIRRPRIFHWRTSLWDRLTANPAAASKPLSETAHWDAMECGSNTCPPTSYVVAHQRPERK